ncbi:helix-turn-helix domain-containing protein [Kribbella italica]|uniref:Transcriptional regulator with XRE-family HTH domain n=1 Tax=Kribbella italica TaxID=1540520 RepID=A0A7W9J0I1_9ACTN|nr:helix-turn-helix transcriptional regulator [Kribbella italica]MBB5833378.1 transcriptional regulator with XRE-family HTH domain [Kribbella italica]
MSEIDDERFIGQRVKMYRKLRNMTQKQLGDFVGKSQSAIAQYESGFRPVADRDVLYGLALALQVTVGDLTGHAEDKANPAVAAFHAQVPRIEAALMNQGHGDDPSDPRPLDALAADARRALKIRMKNDYATLGGILPGLINDLYRHTASDDERTRLRAWSELATAGFVTTLATKGLGFVSLAWNAAGATTEAARIVGDPGAMAAAEFARAQVLLSTPGSLRASLAHSAGGADRLQSELTSPEGAELYGMLHLQAGLTSAAVGQDPAAHIREAAETVRRSGDGSAFELAFGAENVTVWRMSIANEQRRPGAVIEIAESINPEAITTEDRKSRYFIELGRAHVAEKNYRAGMSALLRAELVAPQQVRSRTVVKELVGHMLRRAQRELATGELGKLAQRVGAVPA